MQEEHSLSSDVASVGLVDKRRSASELAMEAFHELFRWQDALKEVAVTSERERYINALSAVVTFLHNVGMPHEVMRPYNDLALMLSDLDKWKVHPVLQKPEGGPKGSPGDTADTWIARSRISLAVLAFVAADRSVEDAARRVAEGMREAVSKARREGRRDGQPRRLVRSWYDQFQSKSVPDEYAMDNFLVSAPRVVNTVRAQPVGSRIRAAQAQMTHLRSLIVSG